MNSNENFNRLTDNPWENLRAAIIGQAVDDYRAALDDVESAGDDTSARKEAQGRANALKRWFRSEWGQFLSFDNGDLIIEKVEKEPRNVKTREYGRPVVCVETGVIYASREKAARETGIKQQAIYDCCRGKRKQAGGLHFKWHDGLNTA